MTFTQSIQAGVQEAWFMFYDANGDPSGSSPTPLANGQSSGAYKLLGIQNVPSSVPEPTSVPVPGDDGNLGNIPFANDAAREAILSFGIQDLVFEGLNQNTPVVQVGEINMGVEDISTLTNATGCLITQSKAVKKNGSGSRNSAWSGRIWPYVQLVPLGQETMAGRTAGVIRYKATFQPAFNHPWGTTIVNNAGNQISAYSLPFKADNPITLHAFRGAITSFTLDRTPSSLSKTTAWADKVALAIASINTPTPRLLTLSTPADGGRPGLTVYEYPI